MYYSALHRCRRSCHSARGIYAYIFCYRVITILPSNFVILVSIFIFILQRQCNRKSLSRVVKILRLVISQQGSDHLLVAPQTSRDGLAESDFD